MKTANRCIRMGAMLAFSILVAACNSATTRTAAVSSSASSAPTVQVADSSRYYGSWSGIWQSDRGSSGSADLVFSGSGSQTRVSFELGNSRFSSFDKLAVLENGRLVTGPETLSTNSSFVYELRDDGKLFVRYTNHSTGDTGTMLLNRQKA